MFRYKCVIEYCGTNFSGMQKQNNSRTVQGALEQALRSFSSNKNVEIDYSGRTDAGVHAYGQVIHFDLNKQVDEYRVLQGVNFHLRKNQNHDVCILSCEIVDLEFNSRFSAKKRHYVYKIKNRKAHLTFENNLYWHVSNFVDIENMKEASKFLIGNHDFTSFRSADCGANSPIKTLDSIIIEQEGDDILLYFTAKSFLYNMVRNITGTLVELFGVKKFKPSFMQDIIDSKNRQKSGIKAPPSGLYFLKVDY
jgi:tRNA pseudouridine38-40 synthase